MKIDNVDLICSNLSNVINMSFRDPGATNPYIAKAIAGLDADEIVPRFYGRSEDPTKTKYYNLSLERREVVIRILLNPDFTADQTYSDLRDDVYRTIASSRTGVVFIVFKLGVDSVAGVVGFITKVEAPHFNEIPEIQVTVRCDDPMLKAMAVVDVDVGAFLPASPTIVDSESTAPHGFKFVASFGSASANFFMQDELVAPSWGLTVTPVGGFESGDKLYFSSEHNNKYLYLDRGGAITHLADAITPGSAWPILFPGTNDFACSGNFVFDEMSHTPSYWGI